MMRGKRDQRPVEMVDQWKSEDGKMRMGTSLKLIKARSIYGRLEHT